MYYLRLTRWQINDKPRPMERRLGLIWKWPRLHSGYSFHEQHFLKIEERPQEQFLQWRWSLAIVLWAEQAIGCTTAPFSQRLHSSCQFLLLLKLLLLFSPLSLLLQRVHHFHNRCTPAGNENRAFTAEPSIGKLSSWKRLDWMGEYLSSFTYWRPCSFNPTTFCICNKTLISATNGICTTYRSILSSVTQ